MQGHVIAHDNRRILASKTLERTIKVEVTMSNKRKLLVDDPEACESLSVSAEDLEWLVQTGQLAPIQIRGKRLFDSSQLLELVRLYKTIQGRTNPDEQQA